MKTKNMCFFSLKFPNVRHDLMKKATNLEFGSEVQKTFLFLSSEWESESAVQVGSIYLSNNCILI